MKYLYLIRHGHADSDGTGLPDFERPLTARGVQDARLMGHRLAAQGARPDAVLCSPAKRAWHTAQLIAAEVEFPAKEIVRQDALYLAGPAELLQAIGTVQDDHASLFVVGHNPGLTVLAQHLTGDAVDHLPPCGIYSIGVSASIWRELAPGCCVTRFVDHPMNARSS